jgi:hypothetical protein
MVDVGGEGCMIVKGREVYIVERVAARTKYKSVEPTTPGSKNHYKVTYHDGQEKWTDAKPGRGTPDRREHRVLKNKLKKPSSQRALSRLDRALTEYEKDEDPKPLEQAVEKNEVGLDREFARTVNRLFVKNEKDKDGEEIDKVTKDGLQVITDHVNRRRRDMSRPTKARRGSDTGMAMVVAGWDKRR